MAENSGISWTTHTWNPWIGCTKISPACDGCYAEAMMDKRFDKVKWGNHPRERTSAKLWNDPYRWQKQAEKECTRPFVFCASLADIFDNQVDPAWRADAFKVMRETPNLVYLLLTKRPQNIVKLAEAAGGLPANAAIGATVEDQKRADINVPALLKACMHLWIADQRPLFTFLSCEPLIGPIDLTAFDDGAPYVFDALQGKIYENINLSACSTKTGKRFIEHFHRIDWVITGGETDQGEHKARPSHPDWFRSLRDQCAAAGVPYHHKQNGEWVHAIHESILSSTENHPVDLSLGRFMVKVGKKRSGRTLDGVVHDAFPEVSAL